MRNYVCIKSPGKAYLAPCKPSCDKMCADDTADMIVSTFGPLGNEEGKAHRYNVGKPEMSHIFDYPRAMAELARVSKYGAAKYDRGNFQKGQKFSLTMDCMLRHLMKWYAGEELDDESGQTHLAHFLWNAVVLVEDAQANREGDDDRMFKRDDIETVDVAETFKKSAI